MDAVETSRPTDSDSELAVLCCDGCGAPVPLAEGELATCAQCDHTMSVPDAHRARHAELHDARADRRRAESAMASLPRPLPAWLTSMTLPLLYLALPVWTAIAVWGWAQWDWFPSPLHMLAWGIFTPVFVLMFVSIDLAAARTHSRRVVSLCATLDGGGWRCRRCGAPLALEIDALAATCDYCRSDNLLRNAGPLFSRALATERHAASASLGEAVHAIQSARANIKTVRIVLVAVLFPFWLLFAGPLLWALFFA